MGRCNMRRTSGKRKCFLSHPSRREKGAGGQSGPGISTVPPRHKTGRAGEEGRSKELPVEIPSEDEGFIPPRV